MKDNLVLESNIYQFGEYVLHSDRKILLFKDEIIPLNRKSYECLLMLVENAGKIVSKEEFNSKIWGGKIIEDRILAVNISNLRKILGTEKDGTNFIQTISGRGYRFLVEVEHLNSDFPNDNSKVHITQADEKVAQLDGKKNPSDNDKIILEVPNLYQQLLKPKALAIGLLLAIICVGTVFFFYNGKKSETNTATLKKVVIFPFENLSQIQEADYLSLAFTDSLNYSLTSLPNVSVISTSQVKQYFNMSYDPIEEGKKLGVSMIVTGSYQKSADKLVVKVFITDISVPNPVIQQAEFVKTTNDLTNLQSNVVRFITSSLHINIPEKDLVALKKQETQNLQAYEYYLRGLNAHTNSKFDDAVLYYKKSLELDPDFDIVSEGLAAVYLTQGNYFGCGEPCADKGIEILEKLKEKDPDNDRVSINLAQSLVELNQAEKGIPMLKKIVEKDPKNYFAYNILSFAYRYAGLLDESNSAYDKSKEDPNYFVLTDKVYWFFNNARLYQGKYLDYIATLNEDGESEISMFNRGLSYFYLKDYEKAKISFTEAYQKQPNAMFIKFSKVYIYYIDNDKIVGLKFLNEIYESMKVNKVYSGEIIFKAAQAYSVYNQKEKALELFDLSVEKGFFCYPYFVNDPLLENIRNEPGFQKTLEKARKRYEAFKQNNSK